MKSDCNCRVYLGKKAVSLEPDYEWAKIASTFLPKHKILAASYKIFYAKNSNETRIICSCIRHIFPSFLFMKQIVSELAGQIISLKIYALKSFKSYYKGVFALYNLSLYLANLLRSVVYLDKLIDANVAHLKLNFVPITLLKDRFSDIPEPNKFVFLNPVLPSKELDPYVLHRSPLPKFPFTNYEEIARYYAWFVDVRKKLVKLNTEARKRNTPLRLYYHFTTGVCQNEFYSA